MRKRLSLKIIFVVAVVNISILALSIIFHDEIDKILFSGIIFCIGMLLVWIIIKRGFNPIHTLVRATKKISQGEFNQQIKVQSEDEIGTLTHSFNQMLKSLQESTQQLKVEQKTIELMARFPQENPHIVLRFDTDAQLIYANPASQQLLSEIKLKLGDIAKGSIKEKIKLSCQKNEKIEYQLNNAKHRYALTLSPQADLGYLNIYGYDISEKEKLKEQLLQSQKLDSIGKLAGGIAHDFNNILGGILGFASLIKSKLKDDPKNITRLDNIIKSANRGAQLTGQLLGFSRKGKYELKTFNVNETIAETCTLLEQTIPKEIKIIQECFSEIKNISGDSGQLQQILLNLGINARDSIKGPGTIKYRSQNIYLDQNQIEKLKQNLNEGEYVKISIEDSGSGIPQDLLPKIFDPFFTTKEIGKGTGLGLATVYGIVENHRGSIVVESELDQGTCFHLFFPVDNRNPNSKIIENFKESHELSLDKIKKTLQEKVVIIAEDEEILQGYYREIFKELGIPFQIASNGKKAIELYHFFQDSVGLIILDMIMPEMHGSEVYTKISRINPDIKAIFATGYTDDKRITQFTKNKNVILLNKPFEIEDLQKAILKHISS